MNNVRYFINYRHGYMIRFGFLSDYQPFIKIASLGRQEPQPAGTGKWPMTLRFGKIIGTTSVVRSIEDLKDVLQKIHRP